MKNSPILLGLEVSALWTSIHKQDLLHNRLSDENKTRFARYDTWTLSVKVTSSWLLPRELTRDNQTEKCKAFSATRETRLHACAPQIHRFAYAQFNLCTGTSWSPSHSTRCSSFHSGAMMIIMQKDVY